MNRYTPILKYKVLKTDFFKSDYTAKTQLCSAYLLLDVNSFTSDCKLVLLMGCRFSDSDIDSVAGCATAQK